MTSPDSGRSLPSGRRRWLLALAFLPFALLIAREWELRPDLDSSDYIQYVEHARALLDGRPYTDTGYVFSLGDRDFAPPAYPPGFPLTLLVPFALFGASLTVAKIVTLIAAVGLLALAGVYFARDRSPPMGAAVVVMLGLSPTFLEYSLSPLSDIPFAAIVWLALLVADREGEWTLRRAALLTVITGLAVSYRPHGLVLVPALGLWGVLNARRLGWKALVPVGALGVLAVIGRLLVGGESLRRFPPVSWLLRQLLEPDLRYHLSVFESHLYPFPGDLPNDVFHVFTTAIMLIGLVDFVRRRPTSLAVAFGVMYTLALGALTAVVLRFTFPLYPLFVFGLLNGVRVLVGRLFPGRGTRAAVVCAAVLATVVTATTLATEPETPRREDPSYRALVEHVAERVEAGEEMRLVFFRPRVLAAETGARAMTILRQDDPEIHLIAWCQASMTHVVLGGFGIGGSGTELSRRAIALHPEAFTTEYRNDEYELLRIDPVLIECDRRR